MADASGAPVVRDEMRLGLCHQGHISAGGIDKDVTYGHADPDLNDALDAAYPDKYRRYSAATLDRITARRHDPPPSNSWCGQQRLSLSRPMSGPCGPRGRECGVETSGNG